MVNSKRFVIGDELHKRVTEAAKAQGISLNTYVNDLVKRSLKPRRA